MSSPVPVTALQPPPVKPLPRSLPPVKPCAAGSLFLGVLCVPNTIHTENTSCGLEEPTSFDGGDDFCRFYTPLTGIVRITQTRWQAAQSVESSVWRYFQGEEDRNDQHSYWFELYLAVDGKKMGHVLEIGSGPFTETKTVLDTVRSRGLDPLVESITLADPLMIYYHTHVASCSYKDGSLMGYPTRFIAAGGEDLHLRDVFDTVIMINVLEHCHDALRVLRTLHESVRPAGGLLIFSERWYDHKWSQYEKQPVPFWDMMHPINVKRAVIEALLDLYEPLYRRDFFYEKSYPTDEGVYFIGLKK
jgi:SAM-dependent methyltransferase